MEHLLSVYAARTARASVADFIGYCGVNQEEVSGILSEGLWLVMLLRGHYFPCFDFAALTEFAHCETSCCQSLA